MDRVAPPLQGGALPLPLGVQLPLLAAVLALVALCVLGWSTLNSRPVRSWRTP